MDYFGYSLPLIFMALLAAGLAISMLTADVLVKTDVKQQVVDVCFEMLCAREDAPLLLLKSTMNLKINIHRPHRQIMNQELMPAKDQPKEKGNMFQAFLPLIMKKVGERVVSTPLHPQARLDLRRRKEFSEKWILCQ